MPSGDGGAPTGGSKAPRNVKRGGARRFGIRKGGSKRDADGIGRSGLQGQSPLLSPPLSNKFG